MASPLPLVGRPPTCLACLRRITSSSQTGSASVALTQVRGKKTEGRLRDQGVVVRLLKDIPQFGPEGSIFRTDRGRMRNHFFPNRKAEYMTRARFSELGLTKEDIGERDYLFGLNRREGPEISDAVEAVAGFGYGSPHGAYAGPLAAQAASELEAPKPAVELEHLPPNRALELMQALVDETLIFERRLVHIPAGGKNALSEPSSALQPEPAKVGAKPAPAPEHLRQALSPLEQRRAMLRGQADTAKTDAESAAKEKEKLELAAARAAEELEREERQKEKEAEERLKIHGSVTLQNIASALKEKMVLDPEAVRIHVQPEDIKFIGLEEDADKVEKIGSFEVEIRAHVGKARVEPIRRKIEVVPH